MNPDKRLRWSRRLSVVPRWCVVPTIQSQTVDQHVFHVTRTAMWLTQYHIEATEAVSHESYSRFKLDVLEHALEHDDEEAATGDRPTPSKNVKHHYGMMPQQAVVVKVADILEALAFLQEEKDMGNSRVGVVFTERVQALREVWGFFAQGKNEKGAPVIGDVNALIQKYIAVLNAFHPGMEQ